MKPLLIVLFLISVSHSLEHTELHSLVSGSPLFTGRDNYNVYDVAGSPLGHFQKGITRLSLSSSFDRLGWNQGIDSDLEGNWFSAPLLRAGEPQTAFFELFYHPAVMSVQNSVTSEKLRLPLHRFGLTLGGKSRSDVIQVSLTATGFYGKQSMALSDNERIKMGLDLIRIDLATRIHELASLGFHIGGDAQIDTLFGSTGYADRWFKGHAPALGAYIDFGNEDFPLRSIAAFDYSISRFLYVSPLGDNDAIRNDSIAFRWQTTGDINAADFLFEPAFLFGISNNRTKLFYPTESNDNPFNLGTERGFNWNEMKTQIGFGTSVGLKEYVTLWGEYLFTGRVLKPGENFLTEDMNRSAHLVNIGIRTDIHNYALQLKDSRLSPRIGFFFQDSHSNNPFPHPFTSSNQFWRYNPDLTFSVYQKTSGFLLGLEGSAGEHFIYDMYLSFLNRDSEDISRSGTGFGLKVGLEL
ncbi:hypothetical protein CHISP_1963 [Chitinispirillum alkaliphilum]|nr:hypothetical protein CHISP_1963 [Chitinispirillum alkaliphilum]